MIGYQCYLFHIFYRTQLGIYYFQFYFFSLCVTCMYTWVPMSTSVCLDMCRPEASIEYFVLSFLAMYFETGSHPNLGAHQLVRLAIQPRIFQSPPQLQDYRHKSPCLAFLLPLLFWTWVLGIQIKTFTSVCQELYPLSFPIPEATVW